MMMNSALFRAALCFATLTLASIADAATYNLSDDWSDVANPTGPWSYRVGTTPLPHADNWTAGVGFPSPQPAYQPSNSAGQFLPAWYKATSVPVGFDYEVGDVIVHTNDSANGDLTLGETNVLFTTPAAGQYQISGGLWNANTSLLRPQDWNLFVNDSVMASGTLSGVPGEFSRNSQQTFNLFNVLLNVGDTVRLDVFRNSKSQDGFFVGTDLTLQAVPIPGAIWLFGSGVIGLIGLARCRGFRQG